MIIVQLTTKHILSGNAHLFKVRPTLEFTMFSTVICLQCWYPPLHWKEQPSQSNYKNKVFDLFPGINWSYRKVIAGYYGLVINSIYFWLHCIVRIKYLLELVSKRDKGRFAPLAWQLSPQYSIFCLEYGTITISINH